MGGCASIRFFALVSVHGGSDTAACDIAGTSLHKTFSAPSRSELGGVEGLQYLCAKISE